MDARIHTAGVALGISWRILISLILTCILAAPRAEDSAAPFDWAEERRFWSFQPPETKSLPAVKNSAWPAARIDHFILARLEENSVQPSPPAPPIALMRRTAFDITGLPPEPAAIEAFAAVIADPARSDAYARWVERLLDSPRFGERMASLWLPLARYAEDQAHQVGDDTKHFYPNAYRYREWVIDAFNRDLPYNAFLKLQLAADFLDPSGENLAALGFIGLGPKYYNRGRLEVRATEYADRVDTVSRAMLGLTVACARCHDHKFEPITMADYYAMAGVFAGTKMVNLRPDGTPEEGKTKAHEMDPGTLHIVKDAEPTDLNIFIRGDVENKGPVAERRFLRILSEGEPRKFTEGSGRKELAEAIASADNPLTARVFVNRVWGLFFGEPLVPTPSNFGHSGQPPSHPDLLDDLAARFIDNGWSTKWLAREIVLSSAYRQSSATPEAAGLNDPANRLLWRMNRKRLTIEQWRDAILAVSGELDNESGKSLELDDPENNRRTVYARISRLKLNDMLMQFDYPDANVHAEKRSETTTPMQKLFVLNSPFMLARSEALAGRLKLHSEDNAARIEFAYRLLFGRAPSETELRLGLNFLEPGPDAWPQYAQVLLASNEFFYVD